MTGALQALCKRSTKKFAKKFAPCNFRQMKNSSGTFSDRMRRVVDRAGGVADVARICGVRTQSVYGWLAGSKPYRERVTRLCVSLGISEQWLWDGSGQEELDEREQESTRMREEHYGVSSSSDSEIAASLAEAVLSFAQVPPAFSASALAEIASQYAEFRRRAEAKASRINGSRKH